MQAANEQQPGIQMKDGSILPLTVDQQRDLELLNAYAQNFALQGQLLKRAAEDNQAAINAILQAAIAADRQAKAAEEQQPVLADVVPFKTREAAATQEAPADTQPAA